MLRNTVIEAKMDRHTASQTDRKDTCIDVSLHAVEMVQPEKWLDACRHFLDSVDSSPGSSKQHSHNQTVITKTVLCKLYTY